MNKDLIRAALKSGLRQAHEEVFASCEEFAVFDCNCEDCITAHTFVELAKSKREQYLSCDYYMSFYDALKELDK